MEKVSSSSPKFYFFNDWVEAQGEPQTCRLCLHIFLMKRGMISQGFNRFHHVSFFFMWFSTIKTRILLWLRFISPHFIHFHPSKHSLGNPMKVYIDWQCCIFAFCYQYRLKSLIYNSHATCTNTHTYTKHLRIFIVVQTPTGAGDRPLAEIRLNRVTMHSNPLAG
jgi:hypothetical protein